MFELTSGADVLSLQLLPVTESVLTDEVAGLSRRSKRGHGGTKKVNVCLLTLTNVLNGADILNIFGGGFGL